jgi:hypothetical protein
MYVIYILYDFMNIYKHEQLFDLCFIQLTNILSMNNHVIIFYNSTNTELIIFLSCSITPIPFDPQQGKLGVWSYIDQKSHDFLNLHILYSKGQRVLV